MDVLTSLFKGSQSKKSIKEKEQQQQQEKDKDITQKQQRNKQEQQNNELDESKDITDIVDKQIDDIAIRSALIVHHFLYSKGVSVGNPQKFKKLYHFDYEMYPLYSKQFNLISSLSHLNDMFSKVEKLKQCTQFDYACAIDTLVPVVSAFGDSISHMDYFIKTVFIHLIVGPDDYELEPIIDDIRKQLIDGNQKAKELFNLYLENAESECNNKGKSINLNKGLYSHSAMCEMFKTIKIVIDSQMAPSLPIIVKDISNHIYNPKAVLFDKPLQNPEDELSFDNSIDNPEDLLADQDDIFDIDTDNGVGNVVVGDKDNIDDHGGDIDDTVSKDNDEDDMDVEHAQSDIEEEEEEEEKEKEKKKKKGKEKEKDKKQKPILKKNDKQGKFVEANILTKDGVKLIRKVKWTDEETKDFIAKLKTYGVGNWAQIAKSDFGKTYDRNAGALKDKYRNLIRSGQIKEEDYKSSTYKKKKSSPINQFVKKRRVDESDDDDVNSNDESDNHSKHSNSDSESESISDSDSVSGSVSDSVSVSDSDSDSVSVSDSDSDSDSKSKKQLQQLKKKVMSKSTKKRSRE